MTIMTTTTTTMMMRFLCLLATLLFHHDAVVQAQQSSPIPTIPFESKWRFDDPIFDVVTGVNFTLTYGISDYIDSNMTYYTLLDKDCQSGIIQVTDYLDGDIRIPLLSPSQKGDGLGTQEYVIGVFVDSNTILNAPEELFSQNEQLGVGQTTARLEFCVKAGLTTPTSQEVVSSETLITVEYDLTDGFNVLQAVTNKNDTADADEAFGSDGYWCDSNGNKYSQEYAESAGWGGPGSELSVCVVPDEKSQSFGMGITIINKFDWVRMDENGGIVTQPAIIDGRPAANGLTNMVCDEDGKCAFQSILRSGFFVEELEAPSSAPSLVPTAVASSSPTKLNPDNGNNGNAIGQQNNEDPTPAPNPDDYYYYYEPVPTPNPEPMDNPLPIYPAGCYDTYPIGSNFMGNDDGSLETGVVGGWRGGDAVIPEIVSPGYGGSYYAVAINSTSRTGGGSLQNRFTPEAQACVVPGSTLSVTFKVKLNNLIGSDDIVCDPTAVDPVPLCPTARFRLRHGESNIDVTDSAIPGITGTWNAGGWNTYAASWTVPQEYQPPYNLFRVDIRLAGKRIYGDDEVEMIIDDIELQMNPPVEEPYVLQGSGYWNDAGVVDYSKAFDPDLTTHWRSKQFDQYGPQWITTDLVNTYKLSAVQIHWGDNMDSAGYHNWASQYKIEVTDDPTCYAANTADHACWTEIWPLTSGWGSAGTESTYSGGNAVTGDLAVQDLQIPVNAASGRYVRLFANDVDNENASYNWIAIYGLKYFGQNYTTSSNNRRLLPATGQEISSPGLASYQDALLSPSTYYSSNAQHNDDQVQALYMESLNRFIEYSNERRRLQGDVKEIGGIGVATVGFPGTRRGLRGGGEGNGGGSTKVMAFKLSSQRNLQSGTAGQIPEMRLRLQTFDDISDLALSDSPATDQADEKTKPRKLAIYLTVVPSIGVVLFIVVIFLRRWIQGKSKDEDSSCADAKVRLVLSRDLKDKGHSYRSNRSRSNSKRTAITVSDPDDEDDSYSSEESETKITRSSSRSNRTSGRSRRSTSHSTRSEGRWLNFQGDGEDDKEKENERSSRHSRRSGHSSRSSIHIRKKDLEEDRSSRHSRHSGRSSRSSYHSPRSSPRRMKKAIHDVFNDEEEVFDKQTSPRTSPRKKKTAIPDVFKDEEEDEDKTNKLESPTTRSKKRSGSKRQVSNKE